MSKSPEHCENHPADRLRIAYPPELPISAAAGRIAELWRRHQVVIVGGATGSGKTTQLPKIALSIGRGRTGRIGCTQPRRLAATAMARRVAQELGVECGAEVGYQVRFDNRTQADTVVKFMTDGILLAETAGDRNLRCYDTLIVDEAHERSLNIDFILGYLKNLLPKRPDLKLAISSATLDVEQFSAFFDHAPVVEVEGRTYPVEDVFLPPEDPDEDLEDQVARAVEFLSELDRRGDILVFLPGEREIRDCTELLTGRKLADTELLPLYARLSGGEQQKVFKPGRARRIILATNVAETSITIPRIRFCIDSHLARISRYNPRTRIQELQVETISQASSRQRRGRCGRTADGVCVHLCSEDDLQRSSPYTDPEIRRTSLAGVILQMAVLKLPGIGSFPFLDPPPPGLIREGLHALEDIRAIQPGGKLTADGWAIARLPLDPHLGKMLLAAREFKVLPELLVITAALSIADPRERPLDKQQAADEAHRKFRDGKSDFLAMLRLWAMLAEALGDRPSHGAVRRCCRQHYLNYNRVTEWRNLVEDLLLACREAKFPLDARKIEPERFAYDQIHLAILSGIPRHFARYVPEYGYYLGTGGRKYDLFPGSGLFKAKKRPAWLMTFALVETSRIFGRNNAEIVPQYVEKVAPHLCVSVCERPEWDETSGFVYAKEKVTSGGLVLHAGRRVHYGKSHPKEARAIFIREGLLPGRVELPGSWVESYNELRRELENLEIKLRRPGTVIDDETIYRHFDLLLPPEAISTEALKKLLRRDSGDYGLTAAAAMQEQRDDFDPADYPDTLEFSGHEFLLEYTFDPGGEEDGVAILAPEDEVNLLPPWALDFLVPGYLPEKVELCLRSLPKALRQQLSPIGERAIDFCAALQRGTVFAGQPLEHALGDFLLETAGVRLPAGAFEQVRLPEFLQMKLAVLDRHGELIQLRRALPARNRTGSQLSLAVRGVDAIARTGLATWPPELALPRSVTIPGADKEACPALYDEGRTVGVRLFLREPEAAAAHRAGLVRLFRLGHADQVAFIRRRLRFPRELVLSWFVRDEAQRYPDELMDRAILAAFGVEPAEIRDADAWAAAAGRAAQTLGEAADAWQEKLVWLLPPYEEVAALMKKLGSRPGVDSRDCRESFEFLFAPRFLRREAVWRDYPRYLRALKIRGERLGDNPARDAEKLATIAPYQERFALALQSVESLTAAPELYCFWELLQEARIAVFTPELPLGVRNPLKQLGPAWENMRL